MRGTLSYGNPEILNNSFSGVFFIELDCMMIHKNQIVRLAKLRN